MAGTRGEAKTRRLLELYLYLTNVRGPVGRDRIRANVTGYGDLGDEAFERQFERDKSDFRSLGIEISVTGSGGSGVPKGYRILRGTSALPELDLTPEEIAVLQVARHMWYQVDLFADASGAVRKLVHEDVLIDDTPLAGLSPRSAGPEPAFDDLRTALRRRAAVRFRYRGSGDATARPRHVQPWQLVLRHGASYLRGFDVDRGAERVFRLSRIVGEVTRSGPEDAYAIPDLSTLPSPFETDPPGDPVEVLVALAPGRAQELRLTAERLEEGQPDAPEGWTTAHVVTSCPAELVGTLAGYGSDVVVIGPPDVREGVVTRLRQVAGGPR